MHFRDVLLFATGALKGHRVRAGLSLLGVAIGVSSVILLTSLGEGARRYVTGEFAALGTNLVIILPGKTETTGTVPIVGGVPNDLTLADVEALRRRVPQVRLIAPVTLGTAAVRHGGRSREVVVLGATAELRPVRDITVQIGRFLPAGAAERDSRVCVIGPAVQAELFDGRNPLGEVLRIGDERFRIIGVTAPRGVTVGMDLDDIVFIPVVRAMKTFDVRSLFRVLVEVRSHEEIDAARDAILQVITERHGEEDVTVVTQDAVLSAFSQVLGILTAVLAAIAAISLAVAGVGIMNVMLVSVSERTGEIGLLKAIGASPRQVLAAFLVEASVLSSAGGGIGLAAGFGAAGILRAIYPVFPAQPPDWAVATAVLVSISVGLIFGALPARRAARLDPIAALARR